MLSQRIGFGAALIAALVGLFFLDSRLGSVELLQRLPEGVQRVGLYHVHGAIVTLVLLALVAFGTREFLRLLAAAGARPLSIWPVVFNLLLVLAVFYAGNGPKAGPGTAQLNDYRLTVVILTAALLVCAAGIARRRTTEGAGRDLAVTLLAVLYLGLLPQFLIRLRLGAPMAGAWLLLYAVGVVKVCDIGAYFTGLAIGRHKLIGWLSPKKTWEGLAGGVGASVLIAVAVPFAIERFAAVDSEYREVFPGLGRAAWSGALMALAGQGGDLLESLFKRSAQAKDSASLIPSFGGVLDLLDSPLAAAPIACWVLLK